MKQSELSGPMLRHDYNKSPWFCMGIFVGFGVGVFMILSSGYV